MASESNYSTPPVIDSFTGKNFWLSNFHEGSPFQYDGTLWPTGEHAFQGLKTHDPAHRAQIAATTTPGAAKGLGRRVPLRPDWEQIKRQVMAGVVAARFVDPGLREQLKGTGDSLLVEGVRHHDQIWGSCVCEKHKAWPGKNWLGLTLMGHRADLLGQHERYTRVAVTGHRPQFFTTDQQEWAQAELLQVGRKLQQHHHTEIAISGMAIGGDQWWGQAAGQIGLDLWAYLPFEAQADKWAVEDKQTWATLRGAASREVVLGDGYDVRLLHARNDLMIRDANLLVCVYDPAKTTGGTASAMKKAAATGVPLLKVNVATRSTTFAGSARAAVTPHP